jgi:colanic acid biosynthesis protein WcaH
MYLDNEKFTAVIENTPLVSIDLVVLNSQGQALLGQRLNRPAKGFWFVPGGRIIKNESLAAAFKRLTNDELGAEFNIENAQLLGPYDHFYEDNVFTSNEGENNFSTHYVAIAYVLKLNSSLDNLPLNEQHNRYQWFSVNDLQTNGLVHQNTKDYFLNKLYSPAITVGFSGVSSEGFE